MAHYWWMFAIGIVLGIVLKFPFIRFGTDALLKSNSKGIKELTAERDRLVKRLHLIGERRRDGVEV